MKDRRKEGRKERRVNKEINTERKKVNKNSCGAAVVWQTQTGALLFLCGERGRRRPSFKALFLWDPVKVRRA